MSLNAISATVDDSTREKQATESRKALVKELTSRTKDARTFWGPQFERMREDIRFAGGDQWQDAEEKMADASSDKYQANFIQRELNQQVSGIYARNPTVKCERRKTLEYTVWDGSEQTLAKAQEMLQQFAPQMQAVQQAQQAVQQFDAQRQSMPQVVVKEPPEITQARQVAAQGIPPQLAMAQAVVRDYMQGVARKALLDKVAATAELLLNRQHDDQKPDFEMQMKSLVVREKTTGAGFVTVKFQRINETVVTSSATHADVVDRLAFIRGLVEQQADDDLTDSQKEQLSIELTTLAQSLQGQTKPRMEGIVLDFKPTTSIIIDPKCRNLFQFAGADWIAEEFMMDPEDVLSQWGIDVREKAVSYQHGQENKNQSNLNTKAGGTKDRDNSVSGNWPDKARACVWIIQDKAAQMKYVICDGYDDFLEEPEAPWPNVEGFWHTVSLKLNLLEVEENHPKAGITIYGQSTVRLLKPMQMELNRSQEAKRDHRFANRPGHICGKDTFDRGDREALANRNAHDCIPLNNIPPGGDVSKVLAAIPTVPLDPALYETNAVMQQALLVTGMQQANLGQQAAGEKATGQAIAEQSRVSGVSSEVDSLNKFLSELARIEGEMAFAEMSIDTVKQNVGPGAAWPTSPESRQQINTAMFMRIEAGSTGRPNKQMDVANLQQMMPQLVPLAQARNLPLDPLIKYAAKVMEFDFDVEDWLASGQPAQGGPQGKGASESISIKLADLTPDERAQALALAGIQATPGASSAAQPTPGPDGAQAPGGGIVNTMLKKAQNI